MTRSRRKESRITKRCCTRQHQLCLKQQHWDSAVLATADPQAHLDNLDAMDEMVSTACLASLEIAVHQLHQPQNWCPNPQSNAHAKLPQETLEHLDPRDPMDHPENLEHQAQMENQAIKDHEDHPAHPAHLEAQEIRVPLEIPEESQERNQAQLVPQALLANQALLVLPADLERLARMAILALLVPPAMLVKPAPLAKLAALVAPETPAKLVHPAAANTALQLVWLLVIKHLWSLRMDEPSHSSIRDSTYPFPLTNTLGVTAQLHALFTFFSTFHVKKLFSLFKLLYFI